MILKLMECLNQTNTFKIPTTQWLYTKCHRNVLIYSSNEIIIGKVVEIGVTKWFKSTLLKINSKYS